MVTGDAGGVECRRSFAATSPVRSRSFLARMAGGEEADGVRCSGIIGDVRGDDDDDDDAMAVVFVALFRFLLLSAAVFVVTSVVAAAAAVAASTTVP